MKDLRPTFHSTNRTPMTHAIPMRTMVIRAVMRTIFVHGMLAAIIFVTAVSPVYARSTPSLNIASFLIQEHYEIRENIHTDFISPISDTAAPSEFYMHTQDGNPAVLIRYFYHQGQFYQAVIPQIDNAYALANRGSYILERDSTNGTPTQLSIFLRNGPDIFIRVHSFPTAKMDIVVGTHVIHRNINIGLTVDELLTAPLERVLRISNHYVNWDSILHVPDSHNYRHTIQLTSHIRPLLPSLPDAEDGATDEYGRLVKIDSGTIVNSGGGFNCSGFAKWVVDGVLFPIANHYLPIQALKARQLDARGTSFSIAYEEDRDPYFGLDWTRALAHAYHTEQYRTSAAETERHINVQNIPYFTYIEDVGYDVHDLHTLLYLLAIREPNTFYLGSINKDFGNDPPLRQHFHIALFFPYFANDGTLQVTIFERNFETNIDLFIERNREHQIHLVRLESSSQFQPPRVHQ